MATKYFTSLTARDLPEIPGVYIFRYRDEVIYVGESRNLRTRVLSHCSGDHVYGVPGVQIAWFATTDHEAVEKELIAALRPRLNNKNWTVLYFWRRAVLGIPDAPDDLVTARLRAVAAVMRQIADESRVS